MSLGRMLLQAPAVETGGPTGSGRRQGYEHMVMGNRKSVRQQASLYANQRARMQLSLPAIVMLANRPCIGYKVELLCEYRLNGSVKLLLASYMAPFVTLLRLRLQFRWSLSPLHCRWPWGRCVSCWRCCCGGNAGRPGPWRCRCGLLGPARRLPSCAQTSRQAHCASACATRRPAPTRTRADPQQQLRPGTSCGPSACVQTGCSAAHPSQTACLIEDTGSTQNVSILAWDEH